MSRIQKGHRRGSGSGFTLIELALGRSFSADPAIVRRCVTTARDAAARAGIGLCAKHWPGLGAAHADSHAALTDLTGTITDAQLALF